MKLLKATTTWTNLELYVFKICEFLCGIIAGYLLRNYLKPFLPYIIFISAITVLWTGYLWVKKMQKK